MSKQVNVFDDSTFVVHLTLGDLRRVIRMEVNSSLDKNRRIEQERGKLLRGVKEICNYLGISKGSLYSKMREYPELDQAIKRNGRTIHSHTDWLESAVKAMHH